MSDVLVFVFVDNGLQNISLRIVVYIIVLNASIKENSGSNIGMPLYILPCGNHSFVLTELSPICNLMNGRIKIRNDKAEIR